MTTATSPTSAEISSADRLEIFELYSRYFHSIDGLTAVVGGKADQNWADTFTADGEFSVVRANGDVLAKVRGTAELIKLHATLPDVETTRHWTNNLLIHSDELGIRGGCYIVAMDIKASPCRIVRSGVYEDRLVKVGAAWKFQSRKLILDPGSPAA